MKIASENRNEGVSPVNAKDRIIEQRMAKRRRNALIVRSLIAFLIVPIIIFIILLIHTWKTEGTFQAFWDDFVSVMTGQGSTAQDTAQDGSRRTRAAPARCAILTETASHELQNSLLSPH